MCLRMGGMFTRGAVKHLEDLLLRNEVFLSIVALHDAAVTGVCKVPASTIRQRAAETI